MFVENALKDKIEGQIKVMKRGDRYYYALRNHSKYHGSQSCEYIKCSNIQLAKQIALRDYYDKVYRCLLKERSAIKALIRMSGEERINDYYRNMINGRKQLVKPLIGTAQYRIELWKNETYEQNNLYPESLSYETERGEMVRSKSEKMIADYLYSMKDFIDYKYERPLVLFVNGKKETIYPDFSIISLKTGEKFILEHVSRLDLPKYHDKFVWKHNAYIENGLVQKGMILYSFESEGIPFSLKTVKKMVREMILK